MLIEHSALSIRQALPGEAAVIVGHRRAMLAEIRPMPAAQLDAIDAAFAPWLATRMTRGEYLGWFGIDPAGQVVAGAGLWIMDWPPHMWHVEPRRGNILNVYVQPAYRRRGLARALTERAVDWCRQNGVRMVILHASEAGRPLYSALGFTPTNEMSLIVSTDPIPAGEA